MKTILVSKERGAAIKERRELLGMSQRQLAKEANLSGGYIAQLEAGDRMLGWSAALAICEALGVMPGWIEGLDVGEVDPEKLRAIRAETREHRERDLIQRLQIGQQACADAIVILKRK